MMLRNQLSKMLLLILIVLCGSTWYFSSHAASEYVKTEHQEEQLKKDIKTKSVTLQQAQTKEQLSYRDNRQTYEAQPVIDKFFELFRTYDSSNSYNHRKTVIEKSGIAGINVTNSDLFKTDRQETGEAYIDNHGMSSTFVSSKLYVSKIQNGVMFGKVLVNYRIMTKNSDEQVSTALYDVRYDTQSHRITDLTYDNGIKEIK
ncbi:hypothetical protein D3P96_07720 [Weissella viridescens]|uniref:Uncharacterized protein n=1 Tax=Weissella viridescens TaxID=1629 RepID=A0A3P2RI95_WEIVI|nr:hypothetical protein [Weissella viridescens]RRG17432.1 hypothetical protein D3P96_07720 [Weissella viridescens]